MNKKQKEELKKLISEITNEAKNVIKDYKDNPSEMSGSIIEVHEDSPFVDENFKNNQWEYILRGIPKIEKKSDVG